MLKTIGQALFSTGLQYPKHSNLQSKGEDYEVRTYEATNWVSTKLTDMDADAAMNAGFRRLFKYIQGENEKSRRFVLLPLMGIQFCQMTPVVSKYSALRFRMILRTWVDSRSRSTAQG